MLFYTLPVFSTNFANKRTLFPLAMGNYFCSLCHQMIQRSFHPARNFPEQGYYRRPLLQTLTKKVKIMRGKRFVALPQDHISSHTGQILKSKLFENYNIASKYFIVRGKWFLGGRSGGGRGGGHKWQFALRDFPA